MLFCFQGGLKKVQSTRKFPFAHQKCYMGHSVRYECRYRAFRAAKNAKLTNISNTELGTVDLRTRKETESRAECLEFVESFNKTLDNPK